TEEGAFIDGKITMIGKEDESLVSAQPAPEVSGEPSTESPNAESVEPADDSEPTSAEVTSTELKPDTPNAESPEIDKSTEQE
ncbi:MAG: hypothetical protein CUN53_15200, partial [Phototrophicales bacterium]